MRRSGCSYFRMGFEKGNITFEILDWRRDPLVSQAKGDTCGSLKQTCRVFLRPSHYFNKNGTCYRRKICTNELWLYSYNTQSSPSKNKNINYILIYLRVVCCLSSDAICDSWAISNKGLNISPAISFYSSFADIFRLKKSTCKPLYMVPAHRSWG